MVALPRRRRSWEVRPSGPVGSVMVAPSSESARPAAAQLTLLDEQALRTIRRGTGRAPQSDDSIERQVRALLDSPAVRQAFAIDVAVRDHVVVLEGVCYDDDALRALKRTIMTIGSVYAIENHVDWIVPDCGVAIASI